MVLSLDACSFHPDFGLLDQLKEFANDADDYPHKHVGGAQAFICNSPGPDMCIFTHERPKSLAVVGNEPLRIDALAFEDHKLPETQHCHGCTSLSELNHECVV